MKLGLRARVFLASLGLIVVSVVVASFYARGAVETRLMEEAHRQLSVRTRLVAARLEAEGASLRDSARLQRTVQACAALASAQVVVFSAEGAMRASSDGTLDALNHAADVDIQRAEASARGEPAGFLLAGRKLASAASFQSAGERGVVRVALSLGEVDGALDTFGRMLTFGTALALIAALLMASLVAQFTARGLRGLNEVARRMVGGDLEARSGLEGDDDVAELGRTLDQLAKGLSRSLLDLRRERDRLAGILEGMHEGVLLLDSRRRIALLNPALREMLLLPADSVGKPLLDAVRHAELKDLFDEASDAGEPTVREVEIGTIKPRRLLARVAKMHGSARQMVAVFVDVTEVRRLESMRRDFVANVSHELRTPVTAIRSAAETLVDGAASDPVAAATFIGIIERNATRLHALVEDLLDLSRIEQRGFRLNVEPLELPPIFSQVFGLFRERALQKALTLVDQMEQALPAVRADRRAIEHVVTNLIDNAVKYCGPGARIWLAAAVGPEYVTITLADDGPGIPERHLPRIFERFYRVDAGRSRDVGGTGLGLSIVKHLVEAMGGVVNVESALNGGTKFSFTLRRSEPEHASSRAVA